MSELWNDLLYTDVLQSDGFVVDYAVLTTYSMELPQLLSIPFALGAIDLGDDALRTPHLAIEGIDRSARKFAVFCNAGSIAAPPTDNKVYHLLGRSVVPISLPAKGAGFANFHAKVWVVSETNPDNGDRQLKVVVLSRNLTSSNDLDVACELVGRIGAQESSPEARAKHRPLGDFLTWLAAWAKGNRSVARRVSGLVDDLGRVERFETQGSPFADYAFFPMGIDGHDGRSACLEADMLDGAEGMVVISPFVDDETLRVMTNHAPKRPKTLITRHAAVSQEALALFNDGVYVPKEVLTSKMDKDVTVDLHEKVYFVYNRHGNCLYLGSTNATRNGFGRNVEFLLRLDFAPYATSYKKFRDELIGDGKDAPLEQASAAVAPTAEAADGRQDELAIRQAISAGLAAEARKCGETYTLTVRAKAGRLPEQEITIHPLGCDATAQKLDAEVAFCEMGLDMLTEWYVVSTGDVKRIVKIETIGIPTEERDGAIFRSIIDTKGKFLSYLSYLLADGAELQAKAESGQTAKHGDSAAQEQEAHMALYEDMVQKAYSAPERIAAIRKAMAKADPSVVPDNFAEMFSTFEKAINQIQHP